MIWITGFQGLVGSALSEICGKKKISFVGSGREVDITKPAQIKEFTYQRPVTHVINCAGFTHVDDAEKHPDAAHALNVSGPQNLAELCCEKKIHFLHLSTDYVFDGSNSIPYSEEDPCHPINTYGRTKLEGELAVRKALPSACILRTSWVFGKRGKNFISTIIHKLRQEKQIKVVSDQIGKPTYVYDVAGAILEMLPHSGIFHFADERAVSRFESAQIIFRMAQELRIPLACEEILPVGSSLFPTPAARPHYSALATRKYVKTTGKTPPSWEIGVKELLCDLKESS